MNALSAIMALSEAEKSEKGLLYTPAEIYQQPEAWGKTYDRFLSAHAELKDFLNHSGVDVAVEDKPTVLLVGAGTSDYIGRSVADLLRKKWQCEVIAVPSTDLISAMDSWVLAGRRYLWISFSRSGDSSEGVAALRFAVENHPQVRHLIVTCNAEGKMAREFANNSNVFCLVLDDAVNDRGLAMTSSFSNMVVAAQCLANIDDPDAYAGVVKNLALAGASLISTHANTAAEIAKLGFSSACFVGSGALTGVAREAALKVLELTSGRIYSMSESTLGLRHGPLSAINEETLFVSFLSGDSYRRRYELDLLEELKTKDLGKIRLAISPIRSTRLDRLVHRTIYIDVPSHFPDDYHPPVDVIFGQMLGLFSSLAVGLQPDTPSPNGAISRVVSHVNIYSH